MRSICLGSPHFFHIPHFLSVFQSPSEPSDGVQMEPKEVLIMWGDLLRYLLATPVRYFVVARNKTMVTLLDNQVEVF